MVTFLKKKWKFWILEHWKNLKSKNSQKLEPNINANIFQEILSLMCHIFCRKIQVRFREFPIILNFPIDIWIAAYLFDYWMTNRVKNPHPYEFWRNQFSVADGKMSSLDHSVMTSSIQLGGVIELCDLLKKAPLGGSKKSNL